MTTNTDKLEFDNPIDAQRAEQFLTMNKDELEIYAMNLKDNDPYLRPLDITNEYGWEVVTLGYKQNPEYEN